MDVSNDYDEYYDQVPIKRIPVEVSETEPYAKLECKIIRIGSLKYDPKEEVIFNKIGIRIVASLVDDQSQQEVLHIQHSEIVKILVHFGDTLPVIFIYLLPSCCFYVREKLHMTTPKHGPYFYSCARDEIYKRIILIPTEITEEFKELLFMFYAKPKTIFDEVTAREASEILTKACQRELDTSNGTRTILTYPPGKGGIAIDVNDYSTLEHEKYLNDSIIEFYLKYLCNEVLTEKIRSKIHIFSTFFYTRLTAKPELVGGSNSELELSSAQQRYNGVKNWTKNINIFEKDFLIIPINQHFHWFLAIICFPGLEEPEIYNDNIFLEDNGNIDDAEKQSHSNSDEDISNDSDNQSSTNIKQPCILIFDSLARDTSRNRVMSILRQYLTCEYRAKFDVDKSFDSHSMKGNCVDVPQQSNLTDCGLYLLQFVEHFFTVPITDFSIPIKGLENWFEEIVVTKKREDISNLIKKLISGYSPDSLPLPEISFATVDGKLIEDPIETADEFSEHYPSHDLDDELEDSENNDTEDYYNGKSNKRRNLGREIYKRVKEIKKETESESEYESPNRRYKSSDEDSVYN